MIFPSLYTMCSFDLSWCFANSNSANHLCAPNFERFSASTSCTVHSAPEVLEVGFILQDIVLLDKERTGTTNCTNALPSDIVRL